MDPLPDPLPGETDMKVLTMQFAARQIYTWEICVLI
jgi:hypothetical protein